MFGVDLLLSFPGDQCVNVEWAPRISLLEYNASPDFQQSGDRLKTELAMMFRGVVKIAVAPYFGLQTIDEQEEEDGEIEEREWRVEEERWGWRLIGKGEVRGGM